MTYLHEQRPLTLADFPRMKEAGEKIATLTCYDASFAAVCDVAGVECLLVGDSLANVIQGQTTTLPVTLEQMAYHVSCVARGARRAVIAADMPWGSFQESPQQAMRNAATLMAAGAHMVKIEGGAHMAETVRFLVERGVPVWAHVGLTPQSVHALGGYKVQGRGDAAAKRLLDDAIALDQAGASLMVMEMVPSAVAAEVTRAIRTPTIGIGAGVECSGQVLVIYDMLGVFPGRKARFVRNFMDGASNIQDAISAYVRAVKEGSFPAAEHCY